MPQSLLITGAGGYLGRRLLERVDASKYRSIHCLVRRDLAVPSGITLIRGDLLDPESYTKALDGCRTVLHMAAVTGKSTRQEYFQGNTEATRMLLEQAQRAGVANILYVSSIAAAFPDQSHYHYAQSKAAAEEIVRRSGLRFTIVRPTMIIGKGAPVLDGLAKLAGAPFIPVFGSGAVRVQPVFVDDAAKWLLSLIDSDVFDGKVLGLGGPDVLTIEDLLIRIRRVLHNKEPRLLHIPTGPLLPVLAVLEKVLLPVLPVTAGQLASFRNDGTIERTAPGGQSNAVGKGVDEVLRMVASQ